MKKLLALLAISFIYVSCGEELETYLYVLKNKSSHKVTVKVYYSNFVTDSFSAEANSYIEKEYGWENNFCLIDRYTDSTEIIFDADKKITFYRDSITQTNNIYDKTSYTLVGDKDELKVYYYTLTDSDYSAAK
ncbi:MAG: hypothetical protein IK117_03290 [Bacteroidales bacterium]|nr:hypothetical protein [Bacteroidales bacterium]